MMLDKEMIGQIVQIVDREAFYQADHQIIYDLLVKLYEQNRPVDAIILREELIKRGLYEEVGGRDRTWRRSPRPPPPPRPPPLAAATASTTPRSSARRPCSASSSPRATTSSGTAYAPHEQADLVLDKADEEDLRDRPEEGRQRDGPDGGRAPRSLRE